MDTGSHLLRFLQVLILVLHFVHTLLNVLVWHLRIDAVIVTFEHFAELIVLLLGFFTSRWVTFYERQQRQERARREVRLPSAKKLSLVFSLYFCIFLLLLLQII